MLNRKQVSSAEFESIKTLLSTSPLFNDDVFSILKHKFAIETVPDLALVSSRVDFQAINRKRKLFLQTLEQFTNGLSEIAQANVVGFGEFNPPLFKQHAKISFDDLLIARSESPLLLENVGLHQCDFDLVMGLFKKSRKKDSVVAAMRCLFDGMTLEESGSVLGMSRQGVHQYQKAFADKWLLVQKVIYYMRQINEQESGLFFYLE